MEDIVLMQIRRENIAAQIDKLTYFCLIAFALTFYIDIPVNFITVALILGLIKICLVRPTITFSSKHLQVVIIFLGLMLITVLFNTTGRSFTEGWHAYKAMYLSPVSALLIAYFFRFTKKRALVIISCFTLVLCINAVIAIVQAFYGISIENGRVIGVFSDKMLLAATHMLILPVVISAVVFVKGLPRWLKYFYIGTIILNIPAVILSGTRIVWIGVFVSSVLIFFIGIKNKVKLLALLLVMIFVMTAFVKFNTYSHERFASIDNLSMSKTEGYQSNYERILMWQRAWQIYKKHPIVGIGIDNFHREIETNYKMPAPLATPWHAHNVFFNTLAETGSIGMLGFLILFIYLYYDAIRMWRREKNPAAIAYLFCLLTYNINFLTDVLFCGHHLKLPTYIFWLITGMYISLSRYAQIKKE